MNNLRLDFFVDDESEIRELDTGGGLVFIELIALFMDV